MATQHITDELQGREGLCPPEQQASHRGRQEGQGDQDPGRRAHLITADPGEVFWSPEQGRPQQRGKQSALLWGLPADCHTPVDERWQEVATERPPKSCRTHQLMQYITFFTGSSPWPRCRRDRLLEPLFILESKILWKHSHALPFESMIHQQGQRLFFFLSRFNNSPLCCHGFASFWCFQFALSRSNFLTWSAGQRARHGSRSLLNNTDGIRLGSQWLRATMSPWLCSRRRCGGY